MRKNSYKEPQVHGLPESKMKLKREQSRNNLERRSYSTKSNLTINDQKASKKLTDIQNHIDSSQIKSPVKQTLTSEQAKNS